MMATPKAGCDKIKFDSREEKIIISLTCTCGSSINRLVGFGIYRGEDMISFAACECQSGHKLMIKLVDVAGMVEMPKECIQ